MPVAALRWGRPLAEKKSGGITPDASLPQGRKPHAFDQLMLLPIIVDVAGDGGDRSDDIAILEIVVGFDFNLLLVGPRSGGVAY